jgi:alpha-L-rhamnosidase
MLYAQALESVSRIYGDVSLLDKANRIRKTAVKQSFDGTMFLDHAIRNEDGVLIRQKDCSEACQYYAILFAGIDINDKKYAELRRRVLHAFGAIRREEHPDVAEINAFIGAYLRLEALIKMKEYKLLLRDVEEFFGCMEQETGTLWEYRQHHGSRDHGFASYVVKVMNEAYAHVKDAQ